MRTAASPTESAGIPVKAGQSMIIINRLNDVRETRESLCKKAYGGLKRRQPAQVKGVTT